MRQSMSWQVQGVAEFHAKLIAMGKGDKMLSLLRSGVRAGMVPVRKDAAARLVESPHQGIYAPGYHGHWSYRKGGRQFLLPGFAHRHVKTEVFASKDRTKAKAIVGPVREAFYASQFLEYGIPSRGYAAQPWLVPAFRKNRTFMIQDMKTKMQKRLLEIARMPGPKGRGRRA